MRYTGRQREGQRGRHRDTEREPERERHRPLRERGRETEVYREGDIDGDRQTGRVTRRGA